MQVLRAASLAGEEPAEKLDKKRAGEFVSSKVSEKRSNKTLWLGVCLGLACASLALVLLIRPGSSLPQPAEVFEDQMIRGNDGTAVPVDTLTESEDSLYIVQDFQ